MSVTVFAANDGVHGIELWGTDGTTGRTALLLDINRLGLPAGCEFLDMITPQYTADLVTWGAIGALYGLTKQGAQQRFRGSSRS